MNKLSAWKTEIIKDIELKNQLLQDDIVIIYRPCVGIELDEYSCKHGVTIFKNGETITYAMSKEWIWRQMIIQGLDKFEIGAIEHFKN